MIKKLIEKLFGVKISKVQTKEQVQTRKDDAYYEHLKNKPSSVRPSVNIADNNREISDEEKRTGVENIQSEIYSKGYKAIPEILSGYPEQIITLFVTMQKVALGDYCPETDSLDDTTHEELVQIACELNALQFEKRMIETGKANMSKPQKDLVEKVMSQYKAKFPSAEQPKMPTNKFEASKLIDSLNKKIGYKKKEVKLFKNMTEPQYNKLKYLCTTLEKDMPEVASVQEASVIIGELQAELDTKPHLVQIKMCSEPQLEYMKRLYKIEGKRFTKTSINKFMKLTATEMSKEIQAKKEELEATKPELALASPGQITYMKDLMNRLSVPYAPEALPKMKKEAATAKIDELRRQLLYIASGGSLTKEAIKEMPASIITDLLKNADMERKTKFYEDTPQNVDELYPVQ